MGPGRAGGDPGEWDNSLGEEVVGVVLLSGQVHVQEDGPLLDLLHHRVLHEVVERRVCRETRGRASAAGVRVTYSRYNTYNVECGQ